MQSVVCKLKDWAVNQNKPTPKGNDRRGQGAWARTAPAFETSYGTPPAAGRFWRGKIGVNVARDRVALAALREAGLRTGVVWECALNGRGRQDPARVIAAVADWLHSGESSLDLTGRSTGTGNGG